MNPVQSTNDCVDRHRDQPIKLYRSKTVTFLPHMCSSLATRILRQLAEVEEHKLPMALHITKQNFYVNNLLTGAHTIEQALQLS
jgi:hypothetical protein